MSPRRKAALLMEHVLLAMLKRKEMHGYELHQELGKLPGISKIWNLKQALFYSKLDLLEREGLIQVKEIRHDFTPSRKIFMLTTQGSDSLDNWLRTPVNRARRMQQLFVAKLICASWQSLDLALELVQKQKEVCLGWNQRLSEEEAQLNPQENFAEWSLFHFKDSRDRSTIAWLETVEAELLKQIQES